MSHPDAERWDARYREDQAYNRSQLARSFLVENKALLPRRGRAFVAAMGAGHNAGWLLEQDLEVIGVDISWVAVNRAKTRWPGIQAAVADLERFYFPSDYFDLITNFYFLQRSLWPHYRRALRPGGILMVETLAWGMLQIRPEVDPVYLLQPGELRVAFADWEILHYFEGWDANRPEKPRAIGRLLARKPAAG